MKTKFRPLADNVLLSRLDAEKVTKTGIVIPDIAQEKQVKATVLAVGPGRRNRNGSVQEPAVKVGDVVLLGKWAGSEIKIDDQECVVLKEDDILAVVE